MIDVLSVFRAFFAGLDSKNKRYFFASIFSTTRRYKAALPRLRTDVRALALFALCLD